MVVFVLAPTVYGRSPKTKTMPLATTTLSALPIILLFILWLFFKAP
jgi:hypothetical protein